jgi:hypothetical protein
MLRRNTSCRLELLATERDADRLGDGFDGSHVGLHRMISVVRSGCRTKHCRSFTHVTIFGVGSLERDEPK